MPRARSRSASALASWPSGRAPVPRVPQAPRGRRQAVPGEVVLSNGRTLSRWAYPQAGRHRSQDPIARGPRGGAAALPDRGWSGRGLHGPEEGARAADRRDVDRRWRSPKRPNHVTGWVAASALGALHIVRGRLVVRRSKLRATLYNGAGHAIWSARVGVGRPSLPTPAGHFYVREKLRAIGGPIYGPYALGTSATRRSSPTGPGAESSASMAPTSRSSSRAGPRTAACACATPRSPASGT